MSEIKTEHIVSRPEVCGGKPCIAGTRMRVQDIYAWRELQGTSADEIASRFEHITMAFVEQMKLKHPSPLKDKLAGKKGQDNPAPS